MDERLQEAHGDKQYDGILGMVSALSIRLQSSIDKRYFIFVQPRLIPPGEDHSAQSPRIYIPQVRREYASVFPCPTEIVAQRHNTSSENSIPAVDRRELNSQDVLSSDVYDYLCENQHLRESEPHLVILHLADDPSLV